eukprot:snap_masked-scaffold122_size333723-processed-gene-2.16 protein:Tk04125 transcript:snap_masked-scaffold122_size333723-processed-gene-2.16-mRNA-1 annotation:"predicted protein"
MDHDYAYRLNPHNVVAQGWFFSNPEVISAIKVLVVLATGFLLVQVIRWSRMAEARNPLDRDLRQKRRPYITEARERARIIQKSFHPDQVPSDLDAIVIGSGIGGLTAAALLARAGRRVLVLEQHDQAGGSCHTYTEKGYEFDVGIHYIGQMGRPTILRTLVEQVSEGQLEWEPLELAHDVVSIGYGADNRQYPVYGDRERWIAALKIAFPKEYQGIDGFFALLDETSNATAVLGALKLAPLWLVKLVIHTGLIHVFTKLWRGQFRSSTLEIIQELTSDKDLQTVLSYCWPDYGSKPSSSHFMMQSILNRHYMEGAFYPVGGASEIALNVIPVIEKSGGQVLVRAPVQSIVHNGHKAMGVRVEKGGEIYQIEAPVIISAAGVVNTFRKLLPKAVAETSYFHELLASNRIRPGVAAMSVFVGLNASGEDLKLKKENVWAYLSNEGEKDFQTYLDSDVKDIMSRDLPMIFISFPSTKDPRWNERPGRENKSTCAIISFANWNWYKQFENSSHKKRGDEYEELKDTVGNIMIDQACRLYPQLKHHIDYVEVGTPVTNQFYIGSSQGEIYGLDHDRTRQEPLTNALLRPTTDIPGLYLSGQDVMTCGFGGALFGGLFCAGAVLGRNVMYDLVGLHKQIRQEAKAKSD